MASRFQYERDVDYDADVIKNYMTLNAPHKLDKQRIFNTIHNIDTIRRQDESDRLGFVAKNEVTPLPIRNSSNHIEKSKKRLEKETLRNKHYAEVQELLSLNHHDSTANKLRELYKKSNPLKIVTNPASELPQDSILENVHHIINQGNRDFLYQ